jgi:hypothetical protein
VDIVEPDVSEHMVSLDGPREPPEVVVEETHLFIERLQHLRERRSTSAAGAFPTIATHVNRKVSKNVEMG